MDSAGRNLKAAAIAVASSFAFGACGSSQTAATEAHSATPSSEPAPNSIVAEFAPELRATFLREHEPMPVHDIASDDGSIRLSIEALQAPRIVASAENKGVSQLRFALAEGNVECATLSTRLDPAAYIQNLVKRMVGEDRYAVDRTGASVTKGRPFLYTTIIGRRGPDAQAPVYNIHVAAGVFRGQSFGCVADAPGMRKTFLRIYERAFGSLEAPGTKAPPNCSYRSIYTTHSVGGEIASFTENAVYDLDNGAVEHIAFTSRIGRAMDAHLSVHDSVALRRSTNGQITFGQFVSAESGTFDYKLALNAQGEESTTYVLTGQIMDKDIETSFVVEDALVDIRSGARHMSDFAKDGELQEIKTVGYEPSIDPSKPVTTTVRRKSPASDGHNALIELGPIEFVGTLDDSGNLVDAKMDLGGIEMGTKLAWSEGSLLE